MTVIKSNDRQLRMLGLNDKYTIVKYDNESCSYCKQLVQPYERLSDHELYKEIKFLQIHSSENQVANSEVEQKRMPFLSIYIQGLLIDCGCVRTEKGIVRFLEKLKKAASQEAENISEEAVSNAN